jgi:TRAP-type C4-dicarboxylate transport system permease small subunit
MKHFLLAAGRTFSRAEDILLALLLAVMCLFAVAQIIQRNIWGSGFVWTDELLRILVLWLTMLGSIIASRVDNHIRMDLLLQLFSPLWQKRLRRIIHACTALVCAVLTWAAAKFVMMEIEFGSQLLGGYPSWWFQIIMPVGFFLIAWRYMLLSLWPLEVEDKTGVVPCGL